MYVQTDRAVDTQTQCAKAVECQKLYCLLLCGFVNVNVFADGNSALTEQKTKRIFPFHNLWISDCGVRNSVGEGPFARTVWFVTPLSPSLNNESPISLCRDGSLDVELHRIGMHVHFVITNARLCVFITQVKGDILQIYSIIVYFCNVLKI